MGYLWSRMVCFAGEGAPELSATSQFADMLSSFSTISQEKRHETLPSWLAPPTPLDSVLDPYPR